MIPKIIDNGAPPNVLIVDPNPPGSGMHTPEDMFIYVKFTAYNRDRSTWVTDPNLSQEGKFIEDANLGTLGEIDFIATQVNYNEETGRVEPTPQETYATTNYTNIGGLSDTKSRGVLEGFGIKSIDIKYNASLVPVVDMTFTDVRGASLFDTIGAENRRSPYSIFFKMPYPIFKLSVKGYFGKTVNYCLHMINWTSNFDGSTGNFDISANFIGFQQAFLNDMVLGNIIGAVNTQLGFETLNGLYDEEEAKGDNLTEEEKRNGKKAPTKIDKSVRKIDDFFVKISKLQIEFEDIKEKSPEFERLKSLNTQKNKLKRLQSFIGTPIIKDAKDQKGQYNEHWPNDSEQVYTSPIEDNSIAIGAEYLSIRDFIIFKSIITGTIKEYIETLNQIVVDYVLFISNDPDIDEKSQEDLIDSFHSAGETKTKENYKNFIVSLWETPVPLSTVYDNFQQTKGGLLVQPYGELATGMAGDNPNASFNPSEYFSDDQPNNPIRSLWMGTPGKFSKDSTVQVLDFRRCRAKVAQELHFLEFEIKVQKLLVEKKLNEKLVSELKFNPTIRDVFRIICNNTQAMLETVNIISTSAQKSGNQKIRNSILKPYVTDIPSTTETSYAWPSIYEDQNNKGLEEIYLGDVSNVNSGVFPELTFVEKVYQNLVALQKKLDQVTKATNFAKGLDTDNWFPINPLDYKTNPFTKINNLNTATEMTGEIAAQLSLRTTVLNTYSHFSSNLTPYAQFDGAIANKAIFNPEVKDFIKTNLTKEKIIDFALKESIMEEKEINGTDYFVLVEASFPRMGGVPISGYRENIYANERVDYIIFDDSNITSNGQTLPSEITSEKNGLGKKYKKIVEKKKVEIGERGAYVNYYTSSNNYTSKLGYHVWQPSVVLSLLKSLTTQPPTAESLKKYTIKNITNIDGGSLIGGKINMLNPKPSLINMIDNPNFQAPPDPPKIPSPVLPTYLINSDFYNQQDTLSAKAVLLLSTLPFITFDDAVLSSFGNAIVGRESRILELPTYYLYFIGSLLWRYSFTPSSTDPINWVGYETLQTSKNSYLTNIGAMSDKSPTKLENALIKLPTKTKNILINKFSLWVNQGYFNQFENYVSDYKGPLISVDEPNHISAGNSIVNELNKTTNVILPTSMILFPDDDSPTNLKNGLIVKVKDFEDYFDSFKKQFVVVDEKDEKGSAPKTAEEIKQGNINETKIKLQLYNYFKNINNKWACSPGIINTCGPSGPLIDSFKFINRGWGDIGDEAVINLNSLLTLANDLNTNIYFFLSKILRDSNFLLQILPNFINFKDPIDVQEMFTPIVNISEENESGGPQYVCIYVGGVSQALDIKEENKYYFPNDGFSFTEGALPSDLQPDGNQKLVAFRVAFGSENQTIFKNVSLNQQEHRETSEYFQVLAETVDKRGGTQRSFQGNDLLQLFKTRSYTCKIDALGCMNIQPLMYFDLQNVPFFNGAYLITGVNHNITPNHMTTSFTGLRQSKFTTAFADVPTVFLNIDLNEDLNVTPIVFSNLLTSDIIYSIGLEDTAVNAPFIGLNSPGLTKEILQTLGVTDPQVLEDSTVKEFNIILTQNGIISKSEAMMFISNVLANSNYMGEKNREQAWSTENPLPTYTVYETNLDGSFKKDSNDDLIPRTYDPGGGTVYDPPGNLQQNKYRPANTTFDPPVPEGDLAEFLGNKDPGDGYRYRPRGYLYINGKKEYKNAFATSQYGSYFKKPDVITSTPQAAFRAAAFVWTNKKDIKVGDKGKTANFYANGISSTLGGGNAASFARTILISQDTPNPEKSFMIFEKVLSIYGVISYNKP